MTIEKAIEVVSAGVVSLDEWNKATLFGKKTFLNRQAQAIPIHLQTGAITSEQADAKRKAVEVLRKELAQEENSEV